MLKIQNWIWPFLNLKYANIKYNILVLYLMFTGILVSLTLLLMDTDFFFRIITLLLSKKLKTWIRLMMRQNRLTGQHLNTYRSLYPSEYQSKLRFILIIQKRNIILITFTKWRRYFSISCSTDRTQLYDKERRYEEILIVAEDFNAKFSDSRGDALEALAAASLVFWTNNVDSRFFNAGRLTPS